MYFCSVILGVVTLGAILSSVKAGNVHPSDDVIKVACKPFKQVSHYCMLHAFTVSISTCVSKQPACTLSGAADRQLGDAVSHP